MEHITQEQAVSFGYEKLSDTAYGASSAKQLHDLCNAAIQHYIDSLPKSEPVAWVGFNKRHSKVEFSLHTPSPTVIREFDMRPVFYAPPQPALSKKDMAKVLEALERGMFKGNLIQLREDAITIMQSAIEGMK